MRSPRARARALAALVGLLAVLVLPAPSASAASAGWADVTFGGSANAWTGTVQQRATGFPTARLTSDSAGGTSVGRQSGSSTFLPASSEVGQVYGSSRGRSYLNLRPYTANGAGSPGSSTTVYAFDAPTPASGWTFVLGDVDADQVVVRATGPGGAPVAVDDLGFRSVFNYCGTGGCPANADVPRWDATTGTLLGNAGALDTNGASAWFEPQVPLETLTFVFTRRAGFPVYQTWFAAQTRTLSGAVDAPAEVREGLTVRLLAPDGRTVAETTTGADGEYRFGDLATYDGYQVALVRPTGYTSDDPLTQPVDLGREDRDDVDFSLRAIVPVDVSGGVFLYPDGRPLAGVVVRLDDEGPERLVVTDADGRYTFDDVEPGSYALSLVPPPGTTAPALLPLTVPPDSEEPITDQNLTVYPEPRGTASGKVTFEGGGPAAGVRVTLTTPGGDELVAVTDDQGRWRVDDLTQGSYLVAVVPPPGLEVVGRPTYGVEVLPPGGAFTGLDFVLQAPVVPDTSSAGGTVVDEAGMPFPDVAVTVTDPGGQPLTTVTTGSDGGWQADGLLAGEGWTVTVEPPDGYDPQDEGTLTFDVTDADVTGLDFVLVDEPTAGGGGGSGPGPDGSGSGPGSTLAPTGGPGLGLLLLGLGATGSAIALLRRRATPTRR